MEYDVMEKYSYIKTLPYESHPFDGEINNNHWVLFFSNGKKYKVSYVTKVIIDHLDGTRTLADVVEKLYSHGIPVDIDQLVKLLDKKLIPMGIFENKEGSEVLLPQLNNKAQAGIHIPILRGSKITNILHFLSSTAKKGVVIFNLLFFLSIVTYSYTQLEINKLLNLDYSTLQVVILIILALLTFILHELGHASTAHYFGCPIGDMGIGIYMFRPVLYVNLSDTWKLSKIQRVLTDLSGIYFQIIYCNILLLISVLCRREELTLIVTLNLFLIVFNINPFLKLDGYWVVSDLTGITNMHQKAFDLLEHHICEKLKLTKQNNQSKKISGSKFLNSYIAIYIISNIAFFIFGSLIAIKSLIDIKALVAVAEKIPLHISEGNYLLLGESILYLLFIGLSIGYFVFTILKVIKYFKKLLNGKNRSESVEIK